LFQQQLATKVSVVAKNCGCRLEINLKRFHQLKPEPVSTRKVRPDLQLCTGYPDKNT